MLPHTLSLLLPPAKSSSEVQGGQSELQELKGKLWVCCHPSWVHSSTSHTEAGLGLTLAYPSLTSLGLLQCQDVAEESLTLPIPRLRFGHLGRTKASATAGQKCSQLVHSPGFCS